MNIRKSAVLAILTLSLSGLSTMSMATASFAGTADATLQLTAGNPLVSFLPVTNLLYVAGNIIAPGTNSASASYTNFASLISGVPTLNTSTAGSGNADSGGTGYADATAQSMAFAAFSVINNTNHQVNYTLHFEGQATASGNADTNMDYFYVDSAFVLNKNSVPQFGGFWVWSQVGPGSTNLDTGPQSFDINDTLFAGQTASWSIQSTVDGYARSVPEPTSMALLAMGAVALVTRRRRK